MINFSSGIIDITLKTLKTLNNLNKRKLELLGMGIKDTNTIIVSKIFQPFLKKFDFLGSPKKRIEISTTKNMDIT